MIKCHLPDGIFPAVLIVILGISITGYAHTQTNPQGVGVSLETEIQNIERTVARQGIPPAERHDALVRLARLRQLSGDIEGAAKNWLEAATAIPGRVDDEALLSCAYCLAAMGEWDRALTALEPLVAKLPRARFLDLSIKAIRSGDVSHLAAIVEHPNYAQMKPEIIFVLWKVSRGNTGERWRQRLAFEFPHTPEGQMASGQAASSIVIRPSPFWLFASGLDSLPLSPSRPAGQPAQSASAAPSPSVTATATATPTPSQTPTVTVAQATPAPQTPASQPSQPQTTQPQPSVPQITQTQAPTSQPSASTAKLQTGIYSRQANAQTQATKLREAGFSPTIERRIVNNNEMWAVTVPAGADTNRTIAALRTAGFDSFLIR